MEKEGIYKRNPQTQSSKAASRAQLLLASPQYFDILALFTRRSPSTTHPNRWREFIREAAVVASVAFIKEESSSAYLAASMGPSICVCYFLELPLVGHDRVDTIHTWRRHIVPDYVLIIQRHLLSFACNLPFRFTRFRPSLLETCCSEVEIEVFD